MEALLSTEKYYKDLYFSELLKIKKMLEERQHDQVVFILERVTNITEEVITSRLGTVSGEKVGGRTEDSQETQRRLSELLVQLTNYEADTTGKAREIHTLKQ